jgi:hypothetical protein
MLALLLKASPHLLTRREEAIHVVRPFGQGQHFPRFPDKAFLGEFSEYGQILVGDHRPQWT